MKFSSGIVEARLEFDPIHRYRLYNVISDG